MAASQGLGGLHGFPVFEEGRLGKRYGRTARLAVVRRASYDRPPSSSTLPFARVLSPYRPEQHRSTDTPEALVAPRLRPARAMPLANAIGAPWQSSCGPQVWLRLCSCPTTLGPRSALGNAFRLRSRGVQHSAHINKEVDERPDDRFSTALCLHSCHRLPCFADVLEYHQPMCLRLGTRFGGQEEVLSLTIFDEEPMSGHCCEPLYSVPKERFALPPNYLNRLNVTVVSSNFMPIQPEVRLPQ